MDIDVEPEMSFPEDAMKALMTNGGNFEVREAISLEYLLPYSAEVAEIKATLDGLSATLKTGKYMVVSILSMSDIKIVENGTEDQFVSKVNILTYLNISNKYK